MVAPEAVSRHVGVQVRQLVHDGNVVIHVRGLRTFSKYTKMIIIYSLSL